MKTAIIIPAYNESATIKTVVETVRDMGIPIVVDDCSTDGTGDLARQAGAEVVTHANNRGYDGALQSGFEKAVGLGVDIVVTFDADGQHDAAVLERMIEPILKGRADLVLGIRLQSARLAERVFNGYARLRFGVGDILCGLKAYHLDLFKAHGRFDGVRSIGTELALYGLRHHARFETIPVPVLPRKGSARIGSRWKANAIIFRALFMMMDRDLRESLFGNAEDHGMAKPHARRST